MTSSSFFSFFIHQGYEDWLRHKADNSVNLCPVHVVQHGKVVRQQSRKIRVRPTLFLFFLHLADLSTTEPLMNISVCRCELEYFISQTCRNLTMRLKEESKKSVCVGVFVWVVSGFTIEL